MLHAATITKGDLQNHADEAWNMRKVIWRLYDMAMARVKEMPEDIPAWKIKFVRSKAQLITFYREGQNKDVAEAIADIEQKEQMFKGTVFEPYVLAMEIVACGQFNEYKKENGGKFDG